MTTSVGYVALPVRASVYRVVETQYAAATMRLVDSADAQAVLEEALDTSKPPVPPMFTRLHYLLYTPFRYPPNPWPSRFRGPTDPGVFYAAEHQRTALAEVAHWRLRLLIDAVDVQALEPAAQTIFAVNVEATTLADVDALTPASRRKAVLDPRDYAAAQAWAREVRTTGSQAIRYPSVRDRPAGVCWAVFDPAAFRSKPRLAGNWLLRVTRHGVQCRTVAAPVTAFDFSAAQLQV